MLLDQARGLARSNKELEQMAYVVSHDLRAPLRTVRQFSSFLVEDAGDSLSSEALANIDHIVRGVDRMDRLIVDLLEYCRVGSTKRPAESVDISVIVEDVLDNLKASIAEASGRVELGELPIVCGNPTLLMQLFQNLIANALKFHGDAPPEIRHEI